MSRPTATIIIFLALICVLEVAIITLTNELAEKDVEYAGILEETRMIRQENHVLRDEIITAGALVHLQEKATAAGFVPLPSTDPVVIR